MDTANEAAATSGAPTANEAVDSCSIASRELSVTTTSRGGELSSIRDAAGVEYLWQGDPVFWGGTAPILFPICGSLRDGAATVGMGKTTRMPRHGIVRKRLWHQVGATANEVSYELASDDESRSAFPYDFWLRATYRVVGRSVTSTISVTNSSNEDMPYFVGGHPGFNCPLAKGEGFGDYFLEFELEECCDAPTPDVATGLMDMDRRTPVLRKTRVLPLSHDLFRHDAIVLDSLRSRRVRLRSAQSGLGLELEFGGFDNLLVWSSTNDGPFVALEPWTGLSTCMDEDNVFEHKRGVQTLAPHQTREHRFVIRVL
ncbi:aldose 1-epimerase family protein [Olsenella massiliensis]|uniref:aldose 1-epimerase family protein n=1 Tax=Olsenella massiliensis TaxID=1622075 RepID=UPI0009EB3A2B|nr:aldose 1-epimerase family protein [Olsenella massiliensis]